jgi:hypothetical protein
VLNNDKNRGNILFGEVQVIPSSVPIKDQRSDGHKHRNGHPCSRVKLNIAIGSHNDGSLNMEKTVTFVKQSTDVLIFIFEVLLFSLVTNNNDTKMPTEIASSVLGRAEAYKVAD